MCIHELFNMIKNAYIVIYYKHLSAILGPAEEDFQNRNFEDNLRLETRK